MKKVSILLVLLFLLVSVAAVYADPPAPAGRLGRDGREGPRTTLPEGEWADYLRPIESKTPPVLRCPMEARLNADWTAPGCMLK